MNLLKNMHQRLDRLQHQLWFRIVASIVILVACGGFFGSLLVKSYSLNGQRLALISALTNQNFTRGDEHASSLRSTGKVHINGRDYGGEEFLNPRQPLFDDQGNLLAPPVVAEALLADQRPQWTPDWMLEQPGTTWMLALLATGWLLAIVWMAITLPFLLTLLGTALPVLVCWLAGYRGAMLAFAGIGLLTFTFVLLTRIMLLILNRPWQMLAVAHTVVKEASRTRLSLVFIVILLVALPLLPLWLDPVSPLRYQVQTFIARSMGLTFILAACMTLFLSCATVAFEIRDRQIWQLMTKPLLRFNYLLGKWLGVMAVNLILLLVSGVSIFTFVQYLRELPPPMTGEAGVFDSLAVTDEVLTARSAARPVYPELTNDQVRQRIDDIMKNDPELSAMESIPLPVRRKYEDDLRKVYSAGQRSIPPGGGYREYVFNGLGAAKKLNSTLTLRYRFHILRDDEHKVFPAGFIFNDDIEARRRTDYVPTMSHAFPIGPNMIREDGSIKVRLVNLYEPTPEDNGAGALNFEEKDFEILFKVSNFEGNFLRAVLVSWVKLAFLAAMGVCAATFLSFPVACLLSFTVFIAGVLGPFLAESLEWFYPPENKDMDWSNIALVLYWALHWVIRIIALGVTWLLSPFGEYRPTADLVEGRLIPWTQVLWGLLRIGMVWTGIAMLVGWLVLRKRQLAVYSGQG
jgi:hypothetical protein